jgi:hypothetical protein
MNFLKWPLMISVLTTVIRKKGRSARKSFGKVASKVFVKLKFSLVRGP